MWYDFKINLELCVLFKILDHALTTSSDILLQTKPNDKEQKNDPQVVMDNLLASLKEKGAKNILTKLEEFYLDNGSSAIKFGGSFDYTLNNGNQVKKEYSSIIFNEKGGTQNIRIISDRNNEYAKQLAEKVEESIKFDNE